MLLSYFYVSAKSNSANVDSLEYYTKNHKEIKAFDYARRQSDQFLLKNDFKSYCNLMIRKSELYKKLNDYENALVALFEARKIAEKNRLFYHQSLIYRNIGNINGGIYEYTKAKLYLKKSVKIAEKIKNNDLLIKANQGFFKICFETESDSSEYYLRKVNYYSNLSKNLNDKVNANLNFYHYYTSKGEHKIAKKYLDSVYQKSCILKDKIKIAAAKNNLGVYYMTVENNYEKGKKEYLDILNMFPDKDNAKEISNAYLNISYAYEKLGDYKKALEYNDKYLDFNDQIFNGRLNQTAQEIETKYAVNKVEEAYKFKTQQLVEKQKRNQKILYLLIILLCLIGAIFYVYFQNLKLKQKNKLKDLDTELQYKIISATLDGQDQERNKISEVLHDNVSATLSSVGLHLSAFESTLSTEQRSDLKKTRALLKQAHDKVRDLSHELVPPLLVKFGLQFALRDLCENNSNSLLQFKFHSDLPKNKKFNSELETKIYYFVSELFNNAIKHSEATEVELNLQLVGENLKIIVSDNGKGFATKEKQLGFGLTQIKARVKNMHGEVNVFSQPNEGTIITITVKE